MNAFEEKSVHAPEEDSLVLSSPDSDSEETSTDISAVEIESEGDSANLSPSESGSEGASLDRSLSKNGMEEESPDFVVSEKNGPEKTTPVPPVPGKAKSPKKIAAVILALILAGAAAVFFGYSGWVQFPWMEKRVFWNHGRLLREGWIRMPDGAYCYFGADGDMVTGLQQISGDRYYFDPDSGEMKTGWMTISAAAAGGAAATVSTEEPAGTTAEEAAASATAEAPVAVGSVGSAGSAADLSGKTEGNASVTAAAAQTASPQEDAARMYFRSPSGKAAVG